MVAARKSEEIVLSCSREIGLQWVCTDEHGMQKMATV
jgi:hypothetical protein